jgi:hypothetical protein
MKNIIFRQIHVRMGLKPHATYGEKDAKAPSGGIDTKLVETFFFKINIINKR